MSDTRKRLEFPGTPRVHQSSFSKRPFGTRIAERRRRNQAARVARRRNWS